MLAVALVPASPWRRHFRCCCAQAVAYKDHPRRVAGIDGMPPAAPQLQDPPGDAGPPRDNMSQLQTAPACL